MSSSKLAKILDGLTSVQAVEYTKWSFNDTKVVIGAPSFPLDGLDFIVARPAVAPAKLFSCLTGKGVFASNANMKGYVDIGVGQWALTNGYLQMLGLTGIPFPILIEDIASGGTSSVVATACRLTSTPDWVRRANPEVYTYTYETPRLVLSYGIQLPFVTI